MRRLIRALMKLGLLGAVAALVHKLVQHRSSKSVAGTDSHPWPPITVPDEAQPATASNGSAPPAVDEVPVVVGDVSVAADSVPWLDPDDSVCPESHPVKAKLGSGVFHLPGMMHYDRTKPDRCYVDPASAEADGLRQAKR